jgi:hypothetical protein
MGWSKVRLVSYGAGIHASLLDGGEPDGQKADFHSIVIGSAMTSAVELKHRCRDESAAFHTYGGVT